MIFYFLNINSSYYITRHDISKPYGRHCDETEVKSIKECQVFHNCEEVGTNTEEETEDEQAAKSCLDVSSKAHILVVFPAD